MIKKQWLAVAALFLSIAAGGLIWRYFAGSPATVQTTTHVAKKNIQVQVLASGTLVLLDQVNIGAQVNGQIKAIYVKPGERVKKGDLLLEIDPVLQLNALHKAQASLTSTQAQIKLKKQQVKHLTTVFERQKKIFLIEGVSQADVDTAGMERDTAIQELNVLETQRQQAMLEVDSASANVSYTRITAPKDGTILHIVARAGQTIVSAQASPTLMVIGDPGRMLVKAKISEADITRVAPGQPVWFTIPARPDKKFHSRLDFIEALPESMTDSASGEGKSGDDAVYYNGIFHVENSEGLLRPAMNTQVRIITQSADNALVIPVNALGKPLNAGYFQVTVRDKNGVDSVRDVRTGLISGTDIQVIDGLQESEAVVIPEPS
jgi:macrolide-specific efflux system membrane fusion protein